MRPKGVVQRTWRAGPGRIHFLKIRGRWAWDKQSPGLAQEACGGFCSYCLPRSSPLNCIGESELEKNRKAEIRPGSDPHCADQTFVFDRLCRLCGFDDQIHVKKSVVLTKTNGRLDSRKIHCLLLVRR